MDAEQPGECDGRELGGEGHEGGVATGAAVGGQAREAARELGGGERMAWGSSGEDPWLVVGSGDGGAAVRAVQELAGEFVQRCGQVEGDGAEEQLDPQRAVGDVVAGEAGDAGQGLSVEQHEQAGHAVLDGVAVVVEKAADQRPPRWPSRKGSARSSGGGWRACRRHAAGSSAWRRCSAASSRCPRWNSFPNSLRASCSTSWTWASPPGWWPRLPARPAVCGAATRRSGTPRM